MGRRGPGCTHVVQVLLGRSRGPVRPVRVAGRLRQGLRVHRLLVKSKKRLHNMLLRRQMWTCEEQTQAARSPATAASGPQGTLGWGLPTGWREGRQDRGALQQAGPWLRAGLLAFRPSKGPGTCSPVGAKQGHPGFAHVRTLREQHACTKERGGPGGGFWTPHPWKS